MLVSTTVELVASSQLAFSVVLAKENSSQEATTSSAVQRAENAATARKTEVTRCTIFVELADMFNAFYTPIPTRVPPREQAGDLSSKSPFSGCGLIISPYGGGNVGFPYLPNSAAIQISRYAYFRHIPLRQMIYRCQFCALRYSGVHGKVMHGPLASFFT